METLSTTENPDELYQLFKNAITEISKITSEDVVMDEIVGNRLETVLKQSTFKLLDHFWNLHDISNKLRTLSDLEKSSPKDIVAWRPTTGKIPELNIEGYYLQHRKEQLLKKLTEYQTVKQKLKHYLSKQISIKHYSTAMNETQSFLAGLMEDNNDIVNLVD